MVSCFLRLADFSAYIGTWACFLRVGSVGKLDRHPMTRGEAGLGHFQACSPGLAAFVLRVANLFQPIYSLPVQRLLNGNVLHRRRRRRAVPMLLTRLEPHYVSRTDLLDRRAVALHPAVAERDNQNLAERMRVPR